MSVGKNIEKNDGCFSTFSVPPLVAKAARQRSEIQDNGYEAEGGNFTKMLL